MENYGRDICISVNTLSGYCIKKRWWCGKSESIETFKNAFCSYYWKLPSWINQNWWIFQLFINETSWADLYDLNQNGLKTDLWYQWHDSKKSMALDSWETLKLLFSRYWSILLLLVNIAGPLINFGSQSNCFRYIFTPNKVLKYINATFVLKLSKEMLRHS